MSSQFSAPLSPPRSDATSRASVRENALGLVPKPDFRRPSACTPCYERKKKVCPVMDLINKCEYLGSDGRAYLASEDFPCDQCVQAGTTCYTGRRDKKRTAQARLREKAVRPRKKQKNKRPAVIEEGNVNLENPSFRDHLVEKPVLPSFRTHFADILEEAEELRKARETAESLMRLRDGQADDDSRQRRRRSWLKKIGN